jgi:type VI secretion system secreted protein VgrG
MRIATPLEDNDLLLTMFSGTEGLSIPFSFELTLESESNSIAFDQIIGKNITVYFGGEDSNTRFFNGIVSRFSQDTGAGESDGGHSLARYSATMVPWFWLLTKTTNSRIFQNMSVPDIIEQIFSERGLNDCRMDLDGTYDPKEYCVQYAETDFNFVSRLLEQEGIFYFFEHGNGEHIMVMGDTPEKHPPCPNQELVQFHPIGTGENVQEAVITDLDKMQEVRIGKYTVNDFNFKIPSTDLLVEFDSQVTLGPGDREKYDYPAEYKTRAEGERLANIRLQVEEAQTTTFRGTGHCIDFSNGYKFDLAGHYRPEMNDKAYVLTTVNHRANEPVGTSGGGGGGGFSYGNHFRCVPYDVPYRPLRVTPKPIITGVQTAIVVGPSGEEIYPDKYSRIKVQFPWDREGKNDENSSCWIRVSQPWAGAGWGAMFIPHVGHEVIINFIEGDPDRPIITGRVYHGTNMPADTLPDEKTKSVIRSRQDNDIVIEDKEGDKHIHLKQACGNEIILHEGTPSIDIKQACGNEILMRDGTGIQIRDQAGNEIVLDSAGAFLRLHSPSNDSTIELGKSINEHTTSSRNSTIGGNQTSNVQGSSSSIIFGAKEQTIYGPLKAEWKGIQAKISGGAVSETFLGAKHESLVGTKVTLNAAKEITKNAADRDRQSAGHIYYGSGAYISLEAPGSMLWLDGDGADIMAGSSVIKINKGGPITLTSDSDIKIDSGGDVTIKGGNIKLDGDAKITGKLDHPSITAKK